MITYLVMLTIAIFMAKYSKKITINGNKKRGLAFQVFLVGFPFAIVSALRDSTIGIDYGVYTTIYYLTGYKSTGRGYELLAELVNNIANSMNMPVFIIWFYSIATCFGAAYLIVKKSENRVYSVILFFVSGAFNWSLNIMRQSLATIIVFLALDLLNKDDKQVRNRVLFGAIVVIASLFHMTSLIYLVLIVFPYRLFRERFRAWCIALAVLPFASQGIRSLLIALSSRFNFYYRYFNNYYDQATYTGSLIFASIACFLVIIITYKIWGKYKADKSMVKTGTSIIRRNDAFPIKASILYLSCASTLIGNIIPNNARITFLFFPYIFIALPSFTKLISKKYRKMVEVGLALILVVFYVSSFVINNWGNTIPYKWVF